MPAAAPDLPGETASLLLVRWQSVGVNPRAVAFLPHRIHHRAHPVRRGYGERLHRRAQGLADELQAVEATDRGQDVRGIRTLSPTRGDEPLAGQPFQQQI
ncbi:hypothetical protein [Streptomyces sp. PpalLS-921]|uniref:hypothetical protein n=1 Tax=Streptomyces sp. PpalLS-921 TaxID=1839772 RepID=UPI000B817D4E|nr:hypothetical protein [Streptomyces sp. PpalLS-921]